MTVLTGKIDDSCDSRVSDVRKIFLNTDTGKEWSGTKGDIANVLSDAERGINGDDIRIVKGSVDLFDCGSKIDSVYRR